MAFDVLFLVGRIIVGLYFMMSGFMHFKHSKMMAGFTASRGIPMPGLSNFLAGAFMFLGGLSILLGVYTIIGVALLVIFLLLGAFTVHNFWTYPEKERMGQMANFMKNMGLVGLLLMVLSVTQPWVYSLVF